MRRTPYTERGISRVPCVKCGAPSRFQWRICSDGGWHGVCERHDLELNEMAARWAFGVREAKQLMKGYAHSVVGDHDRTATRVRRRGGARGSRA